MAAPEKDYDCYRGTLSVRAGPMWSGKTTWLNSKLTLFADTGFKVLKITHSDDVRPTVATSDEAGSTHNSSYRSLSSRITVVRCSELKHVEISDFNIIGVDEGQFFGDLKDTVLRWVEYSNKNVFVVGLDGDSSRNKIGQILDLIPIADEFVKLSAYCKACQESIERESRGNILTGSKAPFTKRLVNDTAQVLVGGSESYSAVCRFHHRY